MKPLIFSVLLMTAAGSQASGAPATPVTGDAERGRQLFAACRTCHYPEAQAGNHNGPSLHAIFGRKAGTREGFAYYSDAMKNAGFVWTPELLDIWLANPKTFLPGNHMVFVPPATAQDRADLIEYLKGFR